MKTYTIRPLEWVEIKDGFFEAEICDVRYQAFDNVKFPPTSHDGRRFSTPPAKGWGAHGDWMEGSFHETPEQAKAACEAAFLERVMPALQETSVLPKGDDI